MESKALVPGAARLLGVIVLAIGCRDGNAPSEVSGTKVPAKIAGSALTSRVAPQRAAYTPAEIHQRNPADWVGVAHNQLLSYFVQELRKPGVKMKDMCSRMMHHLADPAALLPVQEKLPNGWRLRMQHDFAGSALCRPPTTTHRASKSLVMNWFVLDDFGTEAHALFDDVNEAIDGSDDPTELASALSPILDAAEELGEIDEAGVQAVVAVAQNSYEYWYASNYAEIVAVESSVEEELDDCFLGQMEEETREADGLTWICHDSDWVVVALRNGSRQRSFLHLVSYPPVPTKAVACWPWGLRLRVIGWGDVAGGISGAIYGIPGGILGILASSITYAVGGSATTAFGAAMATFFCVQ